MTTGQRIKAARKSAKKTQAELGLELGVSASMVAQWENDLRNPKYETLQRIAEALKIPVGELFEVQPLPNKTIEYDLGSKKKKATMSSGAIETEVFHTFLTNMGFTVGIDPTRLKNPNGKDGDVWIIEDTRSQKFYSACTEDLDRLMDSVLSYTKFQIYDLLNKLDTIDEKEIGHYTNTQKPPETNE